MGFYGHPTTCCVDHKMLRVSAINCTRYSAYSIKTPVIRGNTGVSGCLGEICRVVLLLCNCHSGYHAGKLRKLASRLYTRNLTDPFVLAHRRQTYSKTIMSDFMAGIGRRAAPAKNAKGKE